MGEPHLVGFVQDSVVVGSCEGFIADMFLDVSGEVLDPHAKCHFLATLGVQRTGALTEVVDDLFGQGGWFSHQDP